VKIMKTVPRQMKDAAQKQNLGKILVVYNDAGAIRMETEDGEDPYVWRKGRWKPMPPPSHPK